MDTLTLAVHEAGKKMEDDLQQLPHVALSINEELRAPRQLHAVSIEPRLGTATGALTGRRWRRQRARAG